MKKVVKNKDSEIVWLKDIQDTDIIGVITESGSVGFIFVPEYERFDRCRVGVISDVYDSFFSDGNGLAVSYPLASKKVLCERVLEDRGSCYVFNSNKELFKWALKELGDD